MKNLFEANPLIRCFPRIDRKSPREVMVFCHDQMINVITEALDQIDELEPTPKDWKRTGQNFPKDRTVKVEGSVTYVHIHRKTRNAKIVDGMIVKPIRQSRWTKREDKKSRRERFG